jgi:hypothetical protein
MPKSLPAIPNLRRLEIAVAVEIYSLLAESEDGSVDPDNLTYAFGGIAAGLLPVFIERAGVHGYYSYSENRHEYYLTSSGLDLLMEHGRDPNPDIDAYMEHGVPWVLQPDQATITSGLESDHDLWEPLPIDRGNLDYGEMISATEAALQQIEGNNGYAATEPDQRNGIVLAIKGAIETIKSGSPSVNYIKTSLLAPLKFVSTKFSEGVIGQVAKMAAEAVVKWLQNF